MKLRCNLAVICYFKYHLIVISLLVLTHSFVLSASKKAKYTVNTIQLEPKDKLLLYTDGVTEAMNVNNELFGETRFKDIIEKCDLPLVEMLNFIHEKLNTYSLGVVQNDDITMLLLEYKPELYSDDKKSC